MIRELIKIWWSNSFTLMTTTEHPQTFRGLPSLSILHKPLHSPNFLFESTRINGIWCSLHKAVINFLYCGSSQLSAKIAKTAWRLHGNFELIEICVLRTDRISVCEKRVCVSFGELTCQELCMLGEYHVPNRWQWGPSSTLLAKLCWCPLGHQQLVRLELHCKFRPSKQHCY